MNGAKLFNKISISTILIALFYSISFSANALTSVTVKNGITGITYNNFRWVIEEDQTYDIKAGQTCVSGNLADYKECLSLNFHKSYMPVIAQGITSTAAETVWGSLNLDPNKRYFISILPEDASGQAMGGVQIAAGQQDVEIIVTTKNLVTAQIRIFVFNDVAPTNNTPQPGELGLVNFDIKLEDAGGRYGASGQQIKVDVYGNPLGSNYTATGDLIPGSGDGSLLTDADGYVTIKNLAPAKYGIRVVPPTGTNYVQTSTIEGTPIVDAWVKADEPPYFAEFGPPGPHVFIGFVDLDEPSKLTGGVTVSGQISAIHNSRPPAFDFFSGTPVPNCVVALNDSNGVAVGEKLFAAKCDADSNYSIPNVPPGNYSLSFWDVNLDYIFGQYAVTVAATDLVVNPSLFPWFARIEQSVFYDTNGNGFKDPGEVGMPEVATGIRWRDGTVYQGFPTDVGGEAPYDQVFPFFSWLVAEVDFSRYKATGVTVTVDGGGFLAPGENLNPQIQTGAGASADGTTRTETGEVLTQAFQGFLGQTNKIEWGKQVYTTAEIRAGANGGISGIVYYAVTRAEDDPEFAAPEVWEPGIPRIQVELYEYDAVSGGIKDTNLNGVIDKADVDNYPLGWSTGGVMGAEDFDNHLADDLFNAGDAIQITTTDSWDDNVPTNCVTTASSPVFSADGVYDTDCFDGLRNFNQVRPGVFDGGYAFGDIPAGDYIVATGDHRAYKTVKEEDKNVDFGVTFVQPNLLPPACVGTRTEAVPFDYSLFPVTDDTGATVSPLGAGTLTPLCNEKLVKLTGGKNAAADFFLFTDVPVAGHIMGFILNDLANEFDRNSPTFGEKFSPPFLPISIRDWKGNVIGRTYSDRWGSFNVLVPSTYTENLPSSSGISPNMLTTCMNDPGPIPGFDAAGNPAMVVDPNYQKQYSQFCYNFNYMPGVTTYLDTPVLPIAAFSGIGQEALDCEYQNGTPVIWQTLGSVAGPVVAQAGDTLTLTSAGLTTVTNPESVIAGQPKNITRDYGFGSTAGVVTINGIEVPTTTWTDEVITLAIPNSGRLEIKRFDNRHTQAGIHVTVGGNVVVVPQGGSIQDTINSAAVTTGTTVVVPPGTYNEMVVMYKPIKLQGSGASTIITAANVPSNKLQKWDTFVNALISQTPSPIDILPQQEVGSLLPEQITLFTEAGAGIIVLAKNATPANGGFGKLPVLDANGNPIIVGGHGERFALVETVARIDGISITGSDNGGGIVVNAYANDLEVSNNRIYGNFGVYAGGIRVGHPTLINATEDGYANALNDNILIHHNYVAGNGAGNGYGGGISMNHGSKAYQITKNFVCGNFTQGNGGGIGHIGLGSPTSPLSTSLIADNTIIFNQSFRQQNAVSGGGIFIGGGAPIGPNLLSPGSGNIIIDANLIQGNNAGAGNGGGISFTSVNGRDALLGSENSLYTVTMTNNIVVNNVAGLAGGAVSLLDTVHMDMVNNTIAYNDSTATSGEAFCDPVMTTVCSAVVSQPRIAGVVSYAHTTRLRNALATFMNAGEIAQFGLFSNPEFSNNIVWNNRSFHFQVNQGNVVTPFELIPDGINDYGVVGVAGNLRPVSSVLTSTTGTAASNTSGDPLFVNAYVNAPIDQVAVVNQLELTTILGVQPAFDEGGNFIDLRYGPLTLTQPSLSPNNDLGSNYRITTNSSAIAQGNANLLRRIVQLGFDIDNDVRHERVDAGADQLVGAPLEVVNGIALNGVATTTARSLLPAEPAAATASTGGGCTVQTGSRFDPLLPMLMLLSLVSVIRRKLTNKVRKTKLSKNVLNGEV